MLQNFNHELVWMKTELGFPETESGERLSVLCTVPFLGIGKLGGRLERHQLKGRQWAHVLPLHLNRVVIKSGTDSLKYDCRPHWIPQHHWARILSFWLCLYAIGSECYQLLPLLLSIAASDCCMQSLHLDLERSTMPLDQWVLVSVLAR